MKPWYLNPLRTCAVLNRIANRYTWQQMDALRVAMDEATTLLWSKQERYYKGVRPC